MLTLPIAVPGLATALALILAYGQIREFRQSFGFILVGHLVFTLPFMVRTVGAAFRRHELLALEDAARSLGARFGQRFMGVLVPAVLPAIVAGSLMVFTLSVGEFNLTWMLHTPLTRTLPVGLADTMRLCALKSVRPTPLYFYWLSCPCCGACSGLDIGLKNTMELERTRVDVIDCAKTYADGTKGLSQRH